MSPTLGISSDFLKNIQLTQPHKCRAVAPGGRITKEVAQEEISRLKVLWSTAETEINQKFLNEVIGADRAEQLDRFEKVQLADILKLCKESNSATVVFSFSCPAL